jgi:hypothetical protein
MIGLPAQLNVEGVHKPYKDNVSLLKMVEKIVTEMKSYKE